MFLRKMLDLPDPEEPQGFFAGAARDLGIPIPQNTPSADGSFFADAARTLGLVPQPGLYTPDFQPYPGSLGGVSALRLLGSSGAPFGPDPLSNGPLSLTDGQTEVAPNVQLAQAAQPSEDDVNLLGRLIFSEAADHSDVPGAMEGVGWAARNRVGVPGFRKTLPDVILKPGGFDGPKNQQWEKAGDPSKLNAEEVRSYRHALEVARGVLSGAIPDPTGGATFFYTKDDADKPAPPWFEPRIANGRFSEVNKYGNIGKFVFLKDNRRK